MESLYSKNIVIAINSLTQMIEACDNLILWNEDVNDANDFLCSPWGMKDLAANCMLIEAIGEGIKKLDQLLPDFCQTHRPDIDWRTIKGMRDHIAHGYFKIDAGFVFDAVKHEIAPLKAALEDLLRILKEENS